MRKRTVITEDVEGVDCELTFEPVEYCDSHKARVGDMLVYSYLVYDNIGYRDIDDLMGDCMGTLYSFHRDAGRDDHSNGLEALGNNSDGEADLEAVYRRHESVADHRYVEAAFESFNLEEHLRAFGPGGECEFDREEGESDVDFIKRGLLTDAEYHDWECVVHDDIYRDVLEKMWSEPEFFPGDPDAQLLSCYSHSGEHWSLSGHGMQCRWDTSNSAGVWVPGDCLSNELAELTDPVERRQQAQGYCMSFLEQYNDINSGQVFGIVVEWFDEEGTAIEHDSCWGFVGSDHAEESLKETFDGVVKTLQKKYEDDVRTQCGKQLELA